MENFKEILKKEASIKGIELSNEQLIKFEKYKNLLIEWNEKINLTAITDEYGIIMKHFIDSLEIVKYISENQKIIDVGTGAGFPGAVIAIYFEGKVKVTLVDALEKRIKFLQNLTQELKIKNVQIIHGRAEELGISDEYREKYDISTARAVASLNTLLEFNTPFLRVGGKALLLKSNNLDEEINSSNNALKILNCKLKNKYEYNYNVDNEIYNRYIVEIEKISNTPNKYPRNFGKIKKNPL